MNKGNFTYKTVIAINFWEFKSAYINRNIVVQIINECNENKYIIYIDLKMNMLKITIWVCILPSTTFTNTYKKIHFKSIKWNKEKWKIVNDLLVVEKQNTSYK